MATIGRGIAKGIFHDEAPVLLHLINLNFEYHERLAAPVSFFETISASGFLESDTSLKYLVL